MEEKFVVYSHVNKITNVTYIGITKRNPILRWANGFGYKTNPHFWRAIIKYGWNNFNHNILFSNLSKEEAINKEEELIKYYKNIGLSYNISDGRDYVGAIRKRKINAYNRSGKFIRECESIAEASRLFKLSESGIYYCLTMFNGTKYIKDYIFLFPDESIENRMAIINNYKRKGHSMSIEGRRRVSEVMRNRFISEETKRRMSNSHKGQTPANSKQVIMLDINNNVLKTFKSIKEAAEYVGKPKLHSKISDCCNGKRNKTCGYKWKYVEQ